MHYFYLFTAYVRKKCSRGISLKELDRSVTVMINSMRRQNGKSQTEKITEGDTADKKQFENQEKKIHGILNKFYTSTKDSQNKNCTGIKINLKNKPLKITEVKKHGEPAEKKIEIDDDDDADDDDSGDFNDDDSDVLLKKKRVD